MIMATLIALFVLAAAARIWVCVKAAKQDDEKFERQERYIAELEQKVRELEAKQ